MGSVWFQKLKQTFDLFKWDILPDLIGVLLVLQVFRSSEKLLGSAHCCGPHFGRTLRGWLNTFLCVKSPVAAVGPEEFPPPPRLAFGVFELVAALPTGRVRMSCWWPDCGSGKTPRPPELFCRLTHMLLYFSHVSLWAQIQNLQKLTSL